MLSVRDFMLYQYEMISISNQFHIFSLPLIENSIFHNQDTDISKICVTEINIMYEHKFLINNTHISATDTYKYLGTILKPSGSFSATVKHLSNKAKERYLAFIISSPKTDLH